MTYIAKIDDVVKCWRFRLSSTCSNHSQPIKTSRLIGFDRQRKYVNVKIKLTNFRFLDDSRYLFVESWDCYKVFVIKFYKLSTTTQRNK